MSALPEPELWSNKTGAEFHLNIAMDEAGYRWAVKEALAIGMDPATLNLEHLILEDPLHNPELYLPASAVKHSS